jgi:hypothetical protein
VGRGLTFGNDPENPRNGSTDDPLGGAVRVYFIDDNGHLFEVTCGGVERPPPAADLLDGAALAP